MQRKDWLIKLAQARAEAIKSALANAHSIAPERLFLCQPETGSDEKLAGRVGLLI